MTRTRPLALLALLPLVLGTACERRGDASAARAGSEEDAVPVMLNEELPFRYPPALYARKVQGNVTLRLVIDSLGAVVTDSTRVRASSGYPALDSAAVIGSRALRFSPARAHGIPVPVSVLFPVLFRHPDAQPLPGDSSLTHGHDPSGGRR